MMIRRRRCFTNESREASARSSARDRRTPTAASDGTALSPLSPYLAPEPPQSS
jgi:hypothetical protein